MAIDAKGLVLMKSENGILTTELGSYEIQNGLELVYKAYVEDDKVKLFLTTEHDVTDDEYNDIFDEYESEELESEGFGFEEIEEEYNPVWCITMNFTEDHGDMEEDLNFVTALHKKEIGRILDKISG